MSREYVRAAVERELAKLRATGQGARALQAFASSAAVGNFVGAGFYDEELAQDELLEAAIATGLPQREARFHVGSGLRHGMATPRELPEKFERSQPSRASTPRPTIVRSTPNRPPPPSDEVRALWNAAARITEDSEAVAWINSRSLDPLSVEDWDLARVIRPDAKLPTWARTKFGTWIETGHRLLIRQFCQRPDALCIRARCLRADAQPAKSLAPAGFSTAGFVFADALAQRLLLGEVPDWWLRRVVVVEGEPDWLTWASRQSDAHAQGAAVFGVVSGAWTQEIADRIPDGSRAVIRTDHDEAGERYAERIAASLADRCEVLRSRKEGAA